MDCWMRPTILKNVRQVPMSGFMFRTFIKATRSFHHAGAWAAVPQQHTLSYCTWHVAGVFRCRAKGCRTLYSCRDLFWDTTMLRTKKTQIRRPTMSGDKRLSDPLRLSFMSHRNTHCCPDKRQHQYSGKRNP